MISPYINITEEAPEEIGTIHGEYEEFLLGLAEKELNPFMAWRYGFFHPVADLGFVVLASLSFAYPFAVDKKRKILKKINTKEEKWNYFKKTYLKNLVRGGLVIVVPTIIATIVYFCIFRPATLPIQENFFPQNIMSSYFPTQPFIYMTFFTTILFIIGATYATFSLAIGLLTNSMILGVIMPFIYWFYGSMFIGRTIGYDFDPWNIYYFITDDNIPFDIAIIQTSILFIVSSIIIYKKINKKNLNDSIKL